MPSVKGRPGRQTRQVHGLQAFLASAWRTSRSLIFYAAGAEYHRSWRIIHCQKSGWPRWEDGTREKQASRFNGLIIKVDVLYHMSPSRDAGIAFILCRHAILLFSHTQLLRPRRVGQTSAFLATRHFTIIPAQYFLSQLPRGWLQCHLKPDDA